MVCLWRNQLNVDKNSFEQFLDKIEAKYKIWSEFDLVYLIENLSSQQLSSNDEYFNGWFYIMNPSSCLSIKYLDLEKDLRVLDIAAAPGGKTSLIASKMENSGEIIANDISSERIYKMRANFERLGVTNVKIWKGWGEKLWRTQANSFDRVLADVPCSMDDRVEADMIPKRVKQLVPRQRNLIWSAFTCLKIGGVMVYSTCTSSLEENEGVVEWLKEREPNLCQIQEIRRIERDEVMGTFFLAKILKDM